METLIWIYISITLLWFFQSAYWYNKYQKVHNIYLNCLDDKIEDINKLEKKIYKVKKQRKKSRWRTAYRKAECKYLRKSLYKLIDKQWKKK